MLWAIVSLVALLVLPGAILVRVSGTRLPWAIALGPAVTFSIAGLSGWILGALEVRFTLVSALICWLCAVIVALLWRGGWALVARRGTGAED